MAGGESAQDGMPDPPDTGQSNAGVSSGSGLISRRALTKTLAALAIGRPLSETAVAETVSTEACGQYDIIDATDDGAFKLQVNAWSVSGSSVDQCVRVYADGSYGWDWDRGTTGSTAPNYPEVFIGTKLWGPESSVDRLPQQRHGFNEFTVRYDIDLTTSGGEWNLALEWWLTDSEPPTDGSHEFEVMLLLDWSPVHATNLGPVEDPAVIRDRFGNTVDYWTGFGTREIDAVLARHRRAIHANALIPMVTVERDQDRHGTTLGARRKHIFRIRDGTTTGRVDLTEIMDYMSSRFGADSDLWLSTIELGTENWDDTSGQTVIDRLDVTVNGNTYTSGMTNQASADAIEPGVYTIENVNSGKVVNVAESAQSDGADIHQWEDVGGRNQRWDIHSVGDNYTMTAQHSGKFLTVASGGEVVQDDASESDRSQWAIESTSADGCNIQNVATGHLLSVAGASRNDGADIITSRANGDQSHQRWRLYREV